MEDYEIIKSIDSLKKRIFIVRIFMSVITISSIYIVFKEEYFIGITTFIIGMIVTGILGFPSQKKLRKLKILLAEIDE